MRKRLDLVGQKFGRLFVVAFAYVKKGHAYWWCLCDCGEYVIIDGGNLIYRMTCSCGCYQREKASEFNKSRKWLVESKKKISKANKGKIVLIETRKKISESLKGRYTGNKNPNYGNGDKIRGEKNPFYNKHHSEKTRKEISEALKGKNHPNFKHGLSNTKGYKNNTRAKYNAKKKNQTPSNVDLEKIAYIYQVCEAMNQISDEKYEVDHIEPLSKGGLHHQDNLQILRADLNHKKHNKITDEYKGITLKDLEKNVGEEINKFEDIVDLNVK